MMSSDYHAPINPTELFNAIVYLGKNGFSDSLLSEMPAIELVHVAAQLREIKEAEKQ